MPSIEDISIVDSNTAKAKKVEHGLERTLCSPELCDSKNLTVYKRTIEKGFELELKAGKDYHLVYVMSTAPKGTISFKGQSHAAEEGAGVLLTPERWRFRWHDSLVAGAALFIALGWVAITTRDVPIVYVVLAYVGGLCALASLRTRQAQASVAARFRSDAARAWLVDFTILYTLAFILARPAVDAALLPLGSGGNVDLDRLAGFLAA